MERPTIAEQENLIKESLFQFVRTHIPSAQLSSIDEIVLSYVVNILEELASEVRVEEAFDVESFCEIMAAYFPEFSTIDQAAVCKWMFELEATLRQQEDKEECPYPRKDVNVLSMIPPAPITNEDPINKRVHLLSETSDGSSDTSSEYSTQEDPLYVASQVCLLQEMFPEACSLEVRHCLTIAEGDVGRAAQLVIHRQEAGQSLTTQTSILQPPQRHKVAVDDKELKSRIIARYSYIDKNDDVREHRPVGPKSEPKKLVRYRDNKIVSLKGERFTDVKKDDEEDLKKGYVNLKPAKQYRFH